MNIDCSTRRLLNAANHCNTLRVSPLAPDDVIVTHFSKRGCCVRSQTAVVDFDAITRRNNASAIRVRFSITTHSYWTRKHQKIKKKYPATNRSSLDKIFIEISESRYDSLTDICRQFCILTESCKIID